mmetsp:Transcript_21817/g.47644  ORF Transcript_21817/g.47644 Transcript_21817/m.47644 type:complete len:270 (+) Transcript_21817:1181-1990(+)
MFEVGQVQRGRSTERVTWGVAQAKRKGRKEAQHATVRTWQIIQEHPGGRTSMRWIPPPGIRSYTLSACPQHQQWLQPQQQLQLQLQRSAAQQSSHTRTLCECMQAARAAGHLWRQATRLQVECPAAGRPRGVQGTLMVLRTGALAEPVTAEACQTLLLWKLLQPGRVPKQPSLLLPLQQQPPGAMTWTFVSGGLPRAWRCPVPRYGRYGGLILRLPPSAGCLACWVTQRAARRAAAAPASGSSRQRCWPRRSGHGGAGSSQVHGGWTTA